MSKIELNLRTLILYGSVVHRKDGKVIIELRKNQYRYICLIHLWHRDLSPAGHHFQNYALK